MAGKNLLVPLLFGGGLLVLAGGKKGSRTATTVPGPGPGDPQGGGSGPGPGDPQGGGSNGTQPCYVEFSQFEQLQSQIIPEGQTGVAIATLGPKSAALARPVAEATGAEHCPQIGTVGFIDASALLKSFLASPEGQAEYEQGAQAFMQQGMSEAEARAEIQRRFSIITEQLEMIMVAGVGTSGAFLAVVTDEDLQAFGPDVLGMVDEVLESVDAQADAQVYTTEKLGDAIVQAVATALPTQQTRMFPTRLSRRPPLLTAVARGLIAGSIG